MRSRLVVAGAVVALVLVAVLVVTPMLTAWPDDRAVHGAVHLAGLLTAVATCIVVLVRRRTAARLAAGFAVPALLLGAAWWRPDDASRTTSVLVVRVGGTPAPFDSYDIVLPPSAAVELTVAIALPVLVALLWALATAGFLTLARRPDRSPVRSLSVIAAVLAVPGWLPPGARTGAGGALLAPLPEVPAVATVRVAALVVLLVVVGSVLAARRPIPARAAGCLLPAAALSWVWWQTAAGAAVGVAQAGTTAAPTVVDRLPWLVGAGALTALVVVLWVLTVLGWRELLVRYRPPLAVPVSPSGR